ncbi:MAG: AbgT family transporter [Verrucomicrobiae bacterium]|nr:AbgT family transporter [Verrucomicrobiae bacterium]
MSSDSASSSVPHGWVARFLNGIERIGNRLPEPVVLFVVIAVVIPLASALAATAGWTLIHPGTGEPLQAVNLLTPPYLQRMLTEAVSKFVNFPPLGVVLVALLGVGLAEKSGLLAVLLRLLVDALPRRIVTAGVVFAGMLSNVASDAGYVVLVPLAGAVFASVGRHPVAGICAAFAGVSGGFSANLLIGTVDPMLAGFTESAAQLVDPALRVNAVANYYFMAASTLVLTVVGTLVSERLVEPRLGPWPPTAPPVPAQAPSPGNPAPPATPALSPLERSAARWAILTVFLVVAAIVALTAPADGFLRGPEGSFDPFYRSIVPLMAVAFLLPGAVYGRLTGSVPSARIAYRMLSETMASMGGYIVLAFVAAQFIAYFKWSNLGLMLAVSGADLLKTSGLPTPLLLIGVVLVGASVNLFIGSASAKWALMSPVLVPLMMSLGLSPEMAQASYRVGDSVTNIVTPLMPYFPIVLAFAQQWTPGLRLGTFLAAMIPFSLAFLLAWCALLLGWYALDLPLGPGANVLYPTAP